MDSAGEASIAIVGAAGQTGIATLEALRGRPLRALVHRGVQADAVRAAGATEVAVVELDDAATLADAFDGVDAVLNIPPVFNPTEPAQVANVLAAARAAGVERFVMHSVLQPMTPGVRHHERKARSEALVRTAGLRWRILRPAMYMQTVRLYVDRAEGDTVVVPYSLETPFTPIDRADVAAAAAILLTEEGHDFATYELCGRELLNTTEMMTLLGEALGTELRVRAGTAAEVNVSPSWSEEARTDFAAMCEHYDKVGLFGGHRVAEMLLGRPPTAFATALGRDARDDWDRAAAR
jgi:uncharacterized protein YbjT (DUF2867 family)